jgi:4'-phosphopantetheinyl transferase
MPLHVPPDLALPPTVAVALATTADEAALSDEERAVRDGFGNADRRLAFALGRTAARGLLAGALGLDPADVPLRVGGDGAPRVSGYGVSIAHTGRGAAAVAVAAVSRGPVGIDVEAVGPRRADLWRRLLSPSEHAVLDALGGPTDSAQTLLWALKEAVLKGQRTGFRAGARSVVLTLPEALGGRASAVSERSGAWEIAYGRVGGAWLTVAWGVGP